MNVSDVNVSVLSTLPSAICTSKMALYSYVPVWRLSGSFDLTEMCLSPFSIMSFLTVLVISCSSLLESKINSVRMVAGRVSCESRSQQMLWNSLLTVVSVGSKRST